MDNIFMVKTWICREEEINLYLEKIREFTHVAAMIRQP